MSLKRWIAAKLAPEAFDCERRYHWLHSELQEGYRWLGEFDEIAAFLQWLLQHERNTWRRLDEPPDYTWKWYGGVPDFREQLRKGVRFSPGSASIAASPDKGEGG